MSVAPTAAKAGMTTGPPSKAHFDNISFVCDGHPVRVMSFVVL